MAENYTDGLQVDGAFTAGNMAHGVIVITPVANTPTSQSVTGLSLVGTGDTYAFVTALSTVPGDTVYEVSIKGSTLDETGFDVVLYRTNTTDTYINWFAVRRP